MGSWCAAGTARQGSTAYEHQRRCLERPAKSVACQCSTSGLLSGYRARKGLPADAPMDGRIFFESIHAGEAEANEALRSFCRAVAVQIYNLNVLLDLEKVAIGGGISKSPSLWRP